MAQLLQESDFRDSDTEAYPRPQLRRNQWSSLDGEWQFRFEPKPARFTHPRDVDGWPDRIVVPFPVESEASGIGDRGFHTGCWYRREFDCVPGDDRVLLHFGAVDY